MASAQRNKGADATPQREEKRTDATPSTKRRKTDGTETTVRMNRDTPTTPTNEETFNGRRHNNKYVLL